MGYVVYMGKHKNRILKIISIISNQIITETLMSMYTHSLKNVMVCSVAF